MWREPMRASLEKSHIDIHTYRQTDRQTENNKAIVIFMKTKRKTKNEMAG